VHGKVDYYLPQYDIKIQSRYKFSSELMAMERILSGLFISDVCLILVIIEAA